MIVEFLQAMDVVHWWGLGGLFGLAALLFRRRWPLWFLLGAAATGFFVLRQPGMFWYQQWLIFVVVAVVLLVIGRRR